MQYILFNKFKPQRVFLSYCEMKVHLILIYLWLFIGDAMRIRGNNMKFSTFDRDNDILPNTHCAVQYKGAWWYRDCHHANLNGQYLAGHHVTSADGINWIPWHGYHYSLKSSTMMIAHSKEYRT